MADYTITPSQLGVYEIALTAGAEVVVAVTASAADWQSLQVITHSGTAPVYYRLGSTVTVKDPMARVVPVMSFVETPPTFGPIEVHLICNAAAVVSVARS